MDRGQTLHDYAAGISVFVLTVAVVLGLLPSVLAPFQDGTGAADASISSRVADRVVDNLSVAGSPNVLEADELATLLAKDENALRTRYGLKAAQYVNLTLQTLNGSRTLSDGPTPLAAGATAASEDTVTTARIVRVSDPSIACQPACRLVVRVW